MSQFLSVAPFTRVRVDVSRTQDWTDKAPQLQNDDGTPFNLAGYDLRLFVRPTYDHQVSLLSLTRGAGIVVTDEANGLFQFGVTREGISTIPLLPNGDAATYDHFLVMVTYAQPNQWREIWRGPFVVHPGRIA